MKVRLPKKEKSYAGLLKENRALREKVASQKNHLNGLLKRIKGLSHALKVAQEALRICKKNHSNENLHLQFLVKRIKQVCGHETFIKIMNHADAPGGFDVSGYRKKNNLEFEND